MQTKLQVQLNLDELQLDRNQLTELDTLAFQYFGYLNATSLDGNPLSIIGDGAFRPAKIRELSLRDCRLTHISPAALAGLETSLQKLDLGGNNLTSVPENLLRTFDMMRVLNLRDNSLEKSLDLQQDRDTGRLLLTALTELDLSGPTNAAMDFQLLKK